MTRWSSAHRKLTESSVELGVPSLSSNTLPFHLQKLAECSQGHSKLPLIVSRCSGAAILTPTHHFSRSKSTYYIAFIYLSLPFLTHTVNHRFCHFGIESKNWKSHRCFEQVAAMLAFMLVGSLKFASLFKTVAKFDYSAESLSR
jgi:hypothetical protein